MIKILVYLNNPNFGNIIFQNLVVILMAILLDTRAEHYTFQKIGFGVFSSDLLHLNIPINIQSLAPLMSHAQNLTFILKNQAEQHKNESNIGPNLRTLAAFADEYYQNLYAKYEGVIYFHISHFGQATKPSEYGEPLDFSHIGQQAETDEEGSGSSDEMLAFPQYYSTIINQALSSANTLVEEVEPTRQKRGIDATFYDPQQLHPYSPPSGSPPPRTKRFVGAIIAALLGSIGVSSIFGLIDHHQIEQLRAALHTTVARQNMLIHAVEENSKHIATNRVAISQLAGLVEKIATITQALQWKQAGQFVYMLLETELARLNNALDQYTNIIASATQHRMHYSVLTKQGAKMALEEVKKLAKTKGLVPVMNSPQQFSQMTTSYMLTDNGIDLFIHVPLTSEETTFQLYKYNSLPIMLGDKVYARIRPPNEILAVGVEENNGRPRYLEMTSYDLDLCQTLGEVYICRNQQIFNRPSQTTCLFSLFVGAHADAVDQCELELESKKYDQVVAISSDEFLYYGANPSSFVFECQNNSVVRGYQLSSFTKIKIPPFCRAKTRSFVLNRENDLYQRHQPLQWQWTLPPLNFLANETTISDLNSAMEQLEKIKGLPKITPQTIERIRQMNQPFYEKPFSLISLGLGLGAFFLIVALLGVIAYKTLQARRAQSREQNPAYRFRQLMSDHDNLETLVALLEQQAVAPKTHP